MNIDAKNLITKILKPEPEDRLSLEDMLRHPFFTKNLNKSAEELSKCLIKPEIKSYKPFVISKDIPQKISIVDDKIIITESNPKSFDGEIAPTASSQKHGSHNNNVLNYIINSDSKKKEFYDSKNSLPKNSAFSGGNNFSGQGSLLPINTKDLYEKLKKDYENLTVKYNEVVLSKGELNKKLNDLAQKIQFLEKDKESLLKELEEKDNKKLELASQNAEMNQQITLKDEKLKSLYFQVQNLNDSKLKAQQDLDAHIAEYEKTISAKSDENAELTKKINNLEKMIENLEQKSQRKLSSSATNINSLLTNDSIDMLKSSEYSLTEEDTEEGINTKRKNLPGEVSISLLADINKGKKAENELRAYKEKIDAELQISKEYFEKEIKSLRNELKRERENYSVNMKKKDEEIKQITKGEEDIKAQEAKKYEKIIARYEKTLKLREAEIEKLKNQVKRSENLLKAYSIKK